MALSRLRSSYPCIGDWWSRPRTASSSTPLRLLITLCSLDRAARRRTARRCIDSIHPDDTSGRRSGQTAVNRASVPRVAPGRRAAERPTLERMWSQRAVRRLRACSGAPRWTALFTGGASPTDVCDADPYLLRAAKHHGEADRRGLPGLPARAAGRAELHVRRRARAVLRPDQVPGRARADGPRARRVQGVRGRGLPGLRVEPPDLSYVLGDGVPRSPPRRRRTVEDDD